MTSGSDGKQSTYNVGDQGSIPGLGSSPREGNGNPLQYSCLKKSHGQRSLADGLESEGLQRVGHNWVTKHVCMRMAKNKKFVKLKDLSASNLIFGRLFYAGHHFFFFNISIILNVYTMSEEQMNSQCHFFRTHGKDKLFSTAFPHIVGLTIRTALSHLELLETHSWCLIILGIPFFLFLPPVIPRGEGVRLWVIRWSSGKQ